MTHNEKRQNALLRRYVIWTLMEAGASAHDISTAMGIGRARVYQLRSSYECEISRRKYNARGWREPFAVRLRSAGAIP